MLQKYAKDILQDPFYMYLEKTWAGPMIYLAHVVLFYVAGFIAGYFIDGSLYAGFIFGMSLMIWGALVRTVFVWHITWSVNSLTHIFGYRTYHTNEGSRNNLLVTLLTFGEGWHNNHHYDQTSASMWHRWWEVDMNYIFIRGLEKIGLARNVILPKHVRSAKRKEQVQSMLIDRISPDATHSPETLSYRNDAVKSKIENSDNGSEMAMHGSSTKTRV